MAKLAEIDATGLTEESKCPKCEGALHSGIGFELCPHCGHRLKESSVLSRYQVVALGELQQPGGVGATQTTGLLDGSGANKDPEQGEDFVDAGQNSFEQNNALETWVNFAVDMLNRGKDEEQITAQLAHDGCPEPEEVLKRALAQPMEDPQPNEGAEDPFEVPFKEVDPQAQESLSQQPPVNQSVARVAENNIFDISTPKTEPKIFDVEQPPKAEPDIFDVDQPEKSDNELNQDASFPGEKPSGNVETTGEAYKSARVRIVGTSFKGIELERWEDLWGSELVKIALEGGGTINVAPSQIMPDDPTELEHPVTEIQSFIDSMPPVQPTRPSIMARLANLKVVRVAVRQNMRHCGFSDQIKLEQIDREAQEETQALMSALATAPREGSKEYLASQRASSFKVNAYDIAPVEATNPSFDARIAENAAIWYSEQPQPLREDKDQLVYAAAFFAQGYNGNVREFVAEVKKVAYPNERDPGEVDVGWPVRGTGDSVDTKRDDWMTCPDCGGTDFDHRGQCFNCNPVRPDGPDMGDSGLIGQGGY